MEETDDLNFTRKESKQAIFANPQIRIGWELVVTEFFFVKT